MCRRGVVLNRSLRSFLFVWLLSSLFAAAVSAQIKLVPASRHAVSGTPEFAALGDLDGDDVADVVLVLPGTDQVAVLTASASGALFERNRVTVGRRLVGVGVADFDLDGATDVALADLSGGAQVGALLLLHGANDASLAVPASYPLPVSAVEAMTVGEIDAIAGADVALVTGTRSTVHALLNQDSATAFPALAPINLARDPRRVTTARLDGGGRDSLVVLNSNTTRSDEIVLYRFNGTAMGSPSGPFRLTASSALALVADDFDRDGVIDIAVLHDQVDRSFFITTLLNRTTIGEGGAVGTANFDVMPPLLFDCPAAANGDPTRCLPQAIAAGDFDRDGDADLAVSMTRPETVLVLNGVGEGTFGVGQRLNLSPDDEPAVLLAGDVTGDRADDLVVIDSGNDTITVMRADVPALQPDGATCNASNQCESTVCLDAVCCRFAICPSGQRCDIPGNEGSCAPRSSLGSDCDSDDTCNSGFCTDGVCCEALSCGANQACDISGSLGQCTTIPPTPSATPSPSRTPFPTATPAPQANGNACATGSQCQSTLCVDRICCATSCPDGRFCNISDSLGTCAPRKFIGEGCFAASDCLTNSCPDGLCREASTPTSTVSPTPTPTRIPLGGACSVSQASACSSGNCTSGVCCSEPACTIGERCDITGLAGNCQPQLLPGRICGRDTDCVGDAVCALADGATQTTCQPRTTPTPGGSTCGGDCSGDLSVTVDEILVLIEVALGTQGVFACPPGDLDGDRTVSVDEIIAAVGFALTGCPAPATPRSTPTTTATPTVSPTPTPSATATALANDLTEFEAFHFERQAGDGFCPAPDSVYTAYIRPAGSFFALEMTVVRRGDPQTDTCLEQVTTPGESCLLAQALTPVPTLLTPAEVDRLRSVFGAITLLSQPDPSCIDPVPEPCVVNVARWDELEAADRLCQLADRIDPLQAADLVQFLEELRQARTVGSL